MTPMTIAFHTGLDDPAIFWARVAIGHQNECWLWAGPRDDKGYGRFYFANGTRSAHRVAFWLACGPIPKGSGYHGTCVLHRCDNPPCVNPSHLFLGTAAANKTDCVTKVRHAFGEGHGNHKLSEISVQVLRAVYAAGGTTTVQLARWFGVSRRTVRLIRQRKSRVRA